MPGDNKIMKTKEIDRFSEVPQDYPLCINYQCPRASTCLRQLVAQEAADSIKFLMIINPKHQATLKKIALIIVQVPKFALPKVL